MVRPFGITSKGEQAKLYILENRRGMKISVSDYGATLVQVIVKDRNQTERDVVLGYEDVQGYEAGGVFFGATIGRIANRVGKAQFSLKDTVYALVPNDNQNNLHSGPDFYNKRMWNVVKADKLEVVFALHSPDGDQGYPGAVDIQVTYTLTEENEVKIHYYAVPKEDTIINMTNHSYFNLSGHESGSVLEQEVWLHADAFTRADEESIPTGKLLEVEETPMDFREGKVIGRDIELPYEALQYGSGYDHNWVLNQTGFRKVGKMHSEKTDITMEIYTDLPGMQVYSGNFLEKEHGKEEVVYGKRAGICFETQYFPDAMNKKTFKSPVVKKGQVYETVTSYKFL